MACRLTADGKVPSGEGKSLYELFSQQLARLRLFFIEPPSGSSRPRRHKCGWTPWFGPEGRAAMSRNPYIFTSKNLSLMRRMAEQGLSGFEIASTIGSTPGSVRVVCSHHKIRLKRGRRSVDRASQNAVHQPQRGSDHTITAHMPAPLFVEFYRKAENLQISASGLASNLLAAIAMSNIYEAVLDDKD